MKKIGIAGCGGMGMTHLQALKALSEEFDCRITAAADCRAERLAMAAETVSGLSLYQTAEEMIDKAELDVVFITLPTYEHCRAAVQSMQKGLDVFIEKPVCLNKEESTLLLKVESDTRRTVMVGHVIRFAPEYAFLKQLFDDGRYGTLKGLILQRVGAKPAWSYQNWFLNPEKSGTVLVDLAIHDIDFIRYLLGEPRDFSVQAYREADGMIKQALIEFIYESPIVVSAEALWSCAPALPFHMGFRAEFEKAAVVYDSNAQKPLQVFLDSGETLFPALFAGPSQEEGKTGVNVSSLGIYYLEDRYFIESLIKGTPVIKSSLSEAVASLELALSIRE